MRKEKRNMTDSSDGRLGAPLGGSGLKTQETMRLFLGCDEADGPGHDFKKGNVKFEYKYTNKLYARNKHSTAQQRLNPTRNWEFRNLRGHGGKKDYDHLILEGVAEGNSYLFLIGFKELTDLFPTLNTISVTFPLGGGKHRPLGTNSKFVWDHRITKEELKARVDEYARSSEDREGLLRMGGLGESHKSPRYARKDSRSDPHRAERPKSTVTQATLQLPLFLKS